MIKENENISKNALTNNEEAELLHDGYFSLHVLTFTSVIFNPVDVFIRVC